MDRSVIWRCRKDLFQSSFWSVPAFLNSVFALALVRFRFQALFLVLLFGFKKSGKGRSGKDAPELKVRKHVQRVDVVFLQF